MLCVARLVEKKGVDVLIDAVRVLADDGLDVDCSILGDGPLAGELEARASTRRLDGHVRFLGSAPHERVIETMHASDLVVLPCRVAADGDRDALPTALLEAMACGVPCVSTPVGGVPEIVEHETTGLLVSSDSATELARAVRRLATDRELRAVLGRNARRLAEERFDRRRSVARLHQWIDEAAGRHVPGTTPMQPAGAPAEESPDENRLRLR